MKDLRIGDDAKKEYAFHKERQANLERNAQIKDDKTTISPVANPVISSEYGMRKAPVKGASENHPGVDIVQVNPLDNLGTPIVAPKNSKVVSIKSSSDGNGAGNRIHLKANTGEIHSVFHLNSFASGLKVGQSVFRGQQIGEMGNSGSGSGPHAHYEIRTNIGGKTLSPRDANPGLTYAPTTAQARAPQVPPTPEGTITTSNRSYQANSFDFYE